MFFSIWIHPLLWTRNGDCFFVTDGPLTAKHCHRASSTSIAKLWLLVLYSSQDPAAQNRNRPFHKENLASGITDLASLLVHSSISYGKSAQFHWCWKYLIFHVNSDEGSHCILVQSNRQLTQSQVLKHNWNLVALGLASEYHIHFFLQFFILKKLKLIGFE